MNEELRDILKEITHILNLLARDIEDGDIDLYNEKGIIKELKERINDL